MIWGEILEPRMPQQVGMNVSKIVWKAKDRNEFGPGDTHALINGPLSLGNLISKVGIELGRAFP